MFRSAACLRGAAWCGSRNGADAMTKTVLLALLLASAARAGATDYVCDNCAKWNTPQKPFKVYGNTWYVGTQYLSSILITSPQGHILIDGALPQSAPLIAANIRALGFKLEDVKLILNSHAHSDHAGGIAELARISGAEVAAVAYSAAQMHDGNPDDAQFGKEAPYPIVEKVRGFKAGEVQHVGELALMPHATPGHTIGSTSWTWQSCENGKCHDMVYADSITAPGYTLIGNPRQPDAVAEFKKTFATIADLHCEVLMTPHPDASDLLERAAARDAGDASQLIDGKSCRKYSARMQKHFNEQLKAERMKTQR
jgi:metallo-beta-lactamase class B